MEPSTLKNVLESILFVSNRPLRVKDFASILSEEPAAIEAALSELAAERKDSGIIVLESSGHYQLATHSESSTVVKNFLNADLREKLTDATVEVLAIIAYRQPISKAEIESIRGVNSQYSLRQLLMRGMIEKAPNPSDARGFLYQTTTEFLMHLGLNSVADLPEFEKLIGDIKLPETPLVTQEALAEEENEASNEETVEEVPQIIIIETPMQETPTEPQEALAEEQTETTMSESLPETIAVVQEIAAQEPVEKIENDSGEEEDEDDEEDDDDEK